MNNNKSNKLTIFNFQTKTFNGKAVPPEIVEVNITLTSKY